MSLGVLNISLAELKISFKSLSEDISFLQNSTSYLFKCDKSTQTFDYELHYLKHTSLIDLSEYKEMFVGNLQTEDALKYKWYVYQKENNYSIKVVYDNHPDVKVIAGFFSSYSNKIRVYVEGVRLGKLEIDPYIHPFGVLLSFYLLHWNKGVFIHASGIVHQDQGYIFTGVSGIGKSTMAALWHQCGHEVLNDDRLIIRIEKDDIKLFNSPMPYRYQKPACSTLNKVFILNQSPKNYIKQLVGIEAFTKVLANFIQQFYEPEMVKVHLNYLEEILNKVKVYEVGFKPDVEIVDLIKQLD